MLDNNQVSMNDMLLSYLSKNMTEEEITKGLKLKRENDIDLRQIMVLAQSQLKQVDTTKTDSVESVKKQPKLVISNVINFKEFTKTKSRIITVKYAYNKETKVLKYGGVVFNKKNGDKVEYNKQGHLDTATNRFNKCPITITNFVDGGDMDLFHKTLRLQLHYYGVYSKKNNMVTVELTKNVKGYVRKQKAVVISQKNVKIEGQVGNIDNNDVVEKKPAKQFVNHVIILRENNSIITIKYEYDRHNKIVKYGATIFNNKGDKTVKYDQKGHTETATKRFNNKPVVINDFLDSGSHKDFYAKLRKSLCSHGVKAKTQ